MNFTLDQLLALEAISRTGSFAKAAKDLHRVPSAVSYLIRELEGAFGVDLFDRSRRRAELTSQGRRLLDASRAVLEEAQNLDRLAVELRGGWEPDLHVVVDGAVPMGAVNACLRRFADPGIPTCLRVDVEYQEGVVDVFEEAKADLALVLGFDWDGDEEGYVCRSFGELEFLLVASPEHPLAGVTLTPDNRAAHAELLVRDSSPRFEKRAKPSFIGSRNVVYLSDFYSKRAGLIDAAGYGWIPRHFIEDDLNSGNLEILEAETNSWTYFPQLISRESAKLGRASELFMETLLGAGPNFG